MKFIPLHHLIKADTTNTDQPRLRYSSGGNTEFTLLTFQGIVEIILLS